MAHGGGELADGEAEGEEDSDVDGDADSLTEGEADSETDGLAEGDALGLVDGLGEHQLGTSIVYLVSADMVASIPERSQVSVR